MRTTEDKRYALINALMSRVRLAFLGNPFVTVDTVLTTSSDPVILVDATAAPVTITLPDNVDNRNLTFFIKKVDAGPNPVTVVAAGADNIETLVGAGAPVTSLLLTFGGDAFALISDGAGTWWVLDDARETLGEGQSGVLSLVADRILTMQDPEVILCNTDTAGADITLTLPLILSLQGRRFFIRNLGGANNVVVGATAPDDTDVVLVGPGNSAEIVSAASAQNLDLANDRWVLIADS